MGVNLKELSKKEDLFASGHRACAGCGPAIALRQALLISGKDTVVSFSTGCMEVVSTIFPYSAWKVPYIHSLFENSAATMSGVEAAYNALKRKGKIKKPEEIPRAYFRKSGLTNIPSEMDFSAGIEYCLQIATVIKALWQDGFLGLLLRSNQQPNHLQIRIRECRCGTDRPLPVHERQIGLYCQGRSL